MPPVIAGGIFKVSLKTGIKMYEQFIELTNQIYSEGYAEQLAKDDLEKFQMELNDFFNTYQY